MSDSEDDFASADEGEVETDKPNPTEKVDEPKESFTVKPETSKDESSKGDKKEGVTSGQTGTKSKKSKTAQSADKNTNSGAKGNSKQSGNQKKGKNKGGNKAGHKSTEKQKSEKSDSVAKSDDNDISDVSNSEVKEQPKDQSISQSDENKVDKKVGEGETSGLKITEGTDISANKIDSKLNENVTIEKTEADGASDKDAPVNSDTKDSVNTPIKSEMKDSASTPVKSNNNDDEKLKVESSDMIKSPSTQSIPRPEPDHTQEQENVLTKLADAAQEKKQSGWGWGWGSSLLNVASNSVTTFTSQVGEGFNTMIETVESTLNVPSPEDLVKKQADDDGADDQEQNEGTEPENTDKGATSSEPNNREKSTEEIKEPAPEKSDNLSEQDSSNSWFSSWGVGNITKMVESTGKTLVTGSLDVLETLGKKTFDAINEHDPGLKKTRGLIKDRGDKPNLSAVLRDARDHHENQVKQEKESEEARKAHFGTLFDDFQGLAHLEALEMLSNQSEKKVNSLIMALPPDTMSVLKPVLLEVKGHFEINDDDDDDDVEDHDFKQLVTGIYTSLNVGTSPDKLTRVQEKIRQSLKDFDEKNSTEEKASSQEVHQTAIQSLAEFTSKCMEQFHKAGEMILLHRAENSDFVSSSQQLHSLTKVLCTEIGVLSSKFTECLNGCSETDSTASLNQLVTSVYLEASNSSSYVQDGFQLLLPVLQQAAIEKNQEPES